MTAHSGHAAERRRSCTPPVAESATARINVKRPLLDSKTAKITIARSPLQKTRTSDEQLELEAYLMHIASSTTKTSAGIDSLIAATNKHPKSYTASPPDTLAIVQNLVRISNAKRCIEIGVYTGDQLIQLQLSLSTSACSVQDNCLNRFYLQG